MNRTEQKERLTELIEMIENSISGIENNRDDFDEIVADYESLYNRLEHEGYEYVLEDDAESFANKLLKKMLENNADINLIEDTLDSFKIDLDDYAEELSDSKREKIEEKYQDWEDINDKIYTLQNDDDFSMNEMTDYLNDIIDILKQFKK